MTRFFLATLAIISLFPLMPSSAKAEEFNDAQKAEIKKMFDEYLMNSGENILKSVNDYQAALAEKDRLESSKKAETFLKDLSDKNDLPFTGNPQGDVTIIEFFDYNCGYCHKAFEEIQEILKDDPKVKIIFMDMPILGPNSLESGKWALAAHKQGKYFEYHKALMNHKGEKTQKVFESLAKDIGLDVEKLIRDKDDEAIATKLEEQIAQAQEIGIRGTPGFIIGAELFPGYMPVEQMQEAIAEARK